MSRSSSFSADIAEQVCALISVGYGLRKIERVEGMPCKATIMNWLLKGEALKAAGDSESPFVLFLEQYARAREVQADFLAEEILEIADESSYDTAIDENGKRIVNMEHIQRDRLRVDSRKWLAGKLRPKKYGDRIVQEQTGPDGGPIQTETSIKGLSTEELKALAKLGTV